MPNQLRIGVIAPFPPPRGGMSILAEVLTESFNKAGASVSRINTSRLPPNLARRLGLGKIHQHFTFYTDLLRRLDQDVYLLISSSGLSFYTKIFPALCIIRMRGRPVVLDFVGGGILHKLHPLYVFLLRRFKNILVPTPTFQKTFSDKGIPSSVFPHIVRVENFHNQKSSDEGVTLIAAKALVRYSGIQDIIKAFSIIQKELPNAQLKIIGEGPERGNLERFILDRSITGIEFLGSVSHCDMPKIFGSASIFLHGTRIESFGLVLVEAMAAGLPIVSTNSGGIPDVIRDEFSGLLVNYGDYREMARQALLVLTNRRIYEQIRQNALNESKKYSASVLAPKLLTILRQI